MVVSIFLGDHFGYHEKEKGKHHFGSNNDEAEQHESPELVVFDDLKENVGTCQS